MSKTVHLFMFIDALGWEILQQHRFLETELPYRYPVKMQFGYSSTAIPTILSGQPPRIHRHLSFYYFAPDKSPFKLLKYMGLQYLPSRIVDRWRVRHLLSKIIARLYGFTGYFEMYSMPYDRLPWFDYIERKDIFVADGLAPVRNLADELQSSNIPSHISNWRLSESNNIAALARELESGVIRFAFLYTAELDGLLHQHVNEPERIKAKLDYYAERIKALMELARKHYDDFSFTILSDHGMTPLSGTVDVKSKIEAAGLRFGTDYAAVYDSTMARFWLFTAAARECLLPLLDAIPEARRLTPEDKHRYGIDFTDNMYGEEILLMSPGVQIVPSDMGHHALPGMHGFAPEDKDSFASYLSTAPVSTPPQWVGDNFRIMKEKISEVSRETP